MEENNTFLQRIQNYFDRDPFVLVLIDGDGMIVRTSANGPFTEIYS